LWIRTDHYPVSPAFALRREAPYHRRDVHVAFLQVTAHLERIRTVVKTIVDEHIWKASR
jgi:hypothetical protein